MTTTVTIEEGETDVTLTTKTGGGVDGTSTTTTGGGAAEVSTRMTGGAFHVTLAGDPAHRRAGSATKEEPTVDVPEDSKAAAVVLATIRTSCKDVKHNARLWFLAYGHRRPKTRRGGPFLQLATSPAAPHPRSRSAPQQADPQATAIGLPVGVLVEAAVAVLADRESQNHIVGAGANLAIRGAVHGATLRGLHQNRQRIIRGVGTSVVTSPLIPLRTND